MAVVRIPEENRSLHEPDQVRDFLAGIGIDYERWWPPGELPPDASAEQILRAYAKQLDQLKAQGGYVTADVIDVGCRPDTPFPHLEDAVRALRANGFAVSVDSAATDELQRGGAAGANFLLSLTEHTLDIAADTGAAPILIPAPLADVASLVRAAACALSALP